VAARTGHNNIKGAARFGTVRIAGSGGAQRDADINGLEALQAGDRLRLGYRIDRPGFVAALSVDDAGAVTPIYPEKGSSVPARASAQPVYLPESVELTGQGRERVYLVLTDAPVAVDELSAAVKATYQRGGRKLTSLPIPYVATPGLEVYSWLFAKP
jgi:hypothetical protein